MSFQCLRSQKRRARKEHQCTWCGQQIVVGETYTDEFGKFEGEPQSQRFHAECDEALRDAASAEGGYVEFVPHSNPRGRVGEEGVWTP